MTKHVIFEREIMKESERLNQELIFLNNKFLFYSKDFMDEYSILKRAAFRDVQELETMEVSLYVENGRYGGYKTI